MNLLISFFSFLPYSLRIYTGRTLGYIFGILPTREKKIAKCQMRLFLRESFKPSYVPRVFANLGQSVMECINLKPLLTDIESYVETDDLDLLLRLKTSQNGIVALSAHTGNWDLLAAYAIHKGFAVSTIGKKARFSKLQEILADIRKSYGIRTIWRENPDSGREIIKCLKNKGVVAALIDQDTRVKSLHAPFFSLPAVYPVSLVKLAKKSSYPILATFIFRVSSFKYKIFFHQLNNQAPVQEILTEYSLLLEKYIRRFPDQWVWFHKRWRTLEDGSRISGKEYLKYLRECKKNDPSLQIA